MADSKKLQASKRKMIQEKTNHGRYKMIEALKHQYPIECLRRILGIS